MTTGGNHISLRNSVRSSLVVALISGLAGSVMLMQDIVIANHFATSAVADAFQLAVSFPLLAINVLAGGTLLAVLVPLLVRAKVERREADMAQLLMRGRRALGWLLFAVCGMWALTYPFVAAQVGAGFSADTLTLTTRLLWLSVPVLYFSGLASVNAAILQSQKRFVFVSTLPAFMPFGVISGIFFLEFYVGIYAAAIGLLCGSTMQWLASRHLTAPMVRCSLPAATSTFDFSRITRDYGMAATSAAFLSGILLTDTFMASTLSIGSTAAYGYAVRPIIFFLAFVTAAIGNVILPAFSYLAANNDWPALKRHTLFWFGLLALGSLLVVVLWHTNVEQIVALLYHRGAFSDSDTARVVAVQKVYLIQIPFYLVSLIGWRVLNSLDQHATLLSITAICFIVNLTANMWLTPRYGLPGIAWGTNLAFALWAILIAIFLLRLHGDRGALTTSHSAAPTADRIS